MKKTVKRARYTLALACWSLLGGSASFGQDPGRANLSDLGAPPTSPVPSVIGEDPAGNGNPILREQQMMNNVSPMFSPEGYFQPQQVFQDQFAAQYPVVNAPQNPPNYDPRGATDAIKTRLDRRTSGLIGYDNGYTSVGGFVPFLSDRGNLFFIDGRGFVTDNGNFGANLGAGFRTYNEAADRVMSYSAWFDYDNGNINDYSQVGASIAMISRYLQWRANGYFVVSEDSHYVAESLDTNPFYTGSTLNLFRNTEYENAYSGFDLEAGGPAPILGRYGVTAFAGTYWLDGDGDDALGVKGRFDWNVNEDLRIGGTITHDAVFDMNMQLSINFQLPSGGFRRWSRPSRPYDYMTRPDERDYRVHVDREVIRDSVPLRNSGDDEALMIAHIVPDSITPMVTADGTGTVEDPFNSLAAFDALTLAEKAEFDIVLVSGGDGLGTNLDTGITIVENQRLLSSGVTHDITGLAGNVVTPFTFEMPDTGTGEIHLLTNVNSTLGGEAVVAITNEVAVICDSPTEVSGFVIDGTNANILTGDHNAGIITANLLPGGLAPPGATGVTNFDINRNTILNTTDAVNITHVGDGIGVVELNDITGDGHNSSSGITITQELGTLGLLVRNNTVTNVLGEDQDFDGVLDLVGTLIETEDINGNGKLDPGEDLDGDGVIDIFEDNNNNGTLETGWALNVISNSLGSIIFADDPVTSTEDLNNNLVLDTDLNEDINNNGILDVGEDLNGNGVLDTALSEDLNGNGELDEVPTQPFEISDNVFDGNGGGTRLEARDGGQVLATVRRNSNDGNINPNNAGTRLFGNNGDVIITNYLDNSNDGNAGNGMDVIADLGGSVVFTNPITGNTFNNNRTNGLSMQARNGSTLDFQIGDPEDDDATTFDNTFNLNGTGGEGGNGIEIILESGSIIAGTVLDPDGIFNAQVNSNIGHGVLIDVADSTFDGFQIVASEINQNGEVTLLNPLGSDGILVSGENMATGINDLLITGNTIAGNTRNQINFQLSSSDLINPIINSNTISGLVNGVAGPSAFTIDVVFDGGLTASQQAIFAIAASRWSQIIIGDVPDTTTLGGTPVDDVLISASGVVIDGVGGILGQAGPTEIRAGSNIPIAGIMQFDSADLSDLENSGQLLDVILHEMGHVIGIGTVWDDNGLITGLGTEDPRFTGANATAQYNTIFGLTETDVPVEGASAGVGTAFAHWRETTFTNELMTGFLNPGVNPISTITIGQLEDIGYEVNYGAADAYAPLRAVSSSFEPGEVTRTTPLVNSNPSIVAPPSLASLVVVDPSVDGHGINFSLTDSAIVDGVIDQNTISDLSGDGIRMIRPDFGGTTSTLHVQLNTITNNGGYGLNLELDNTNALDLVICANDISNNAEGGIQVLLHDDAVYNNGTISGADAFFGNTVNNNGGPGYYIFAEDQATFDVSMSTPQASTFDGNVDAGIAIEMEGNTVGTVNIENVTITNTTDGANTNLAGDGISISLIDSASIDSLQIGDTSTDKVQNRGLDGLIVSTTDPTPDTTFITDNAGNGIDIFLDGNASLTNATIQNTQITGNQDGVHVEREGSGVIDNFAIGVPGGGNTISDNALDGISLSATNSNINDDYIIEENIIDNNGLRGIIINTEADAEMLVDIRFNQIANNASHGIQTIGAENDPSDEESVAGVWVGNTIDNNGGDGINLNGVYGEIDNILTPLEIGQLGVDGQGRSLGNIITNNADDGIEFSGAGAANVVNNQINDNGGTGIEINQPNGSNTISITDNDILRSGSHGIDIVTDTTSGSNIQINTITTARNIIRGSGGDGIQFLVSEGDNGNNGVNAELASGTLTVIDSEISDNAGRGIDTLIRGGGANGSVTITNSLITRNTLEGVYSVLTADSSQSNTVASTDALLQGGGIFNDPTLQFSISDSEISNNSSVPGFIAGGLVFRVGTTGSAPTFGVGNNSTWQDPGTTDPFSGGGLIAAVDNNVIVNNAGIDFFVHTFTSTLDPATTGGTWTDQNTDPRDASNDEFDVNGYQQDPLARITFTSVTGNTGGSVDVMGASFAIFNDQNFAFYDNAEAVFKSRTAGQDNNTDGGIDDNGPFNSGTRVRNATRLAARNGLAPALDIPGTGGTPGSSDDFLYSGIGESTLQVSAASDLTFLGFTNVLFDFTDALNFANNGGISTLDTRYEWETF